MLLERSCLVRFHSPCAKKRYIYYCEGIRIAPLCMAPLLGHIYFIEILPLVTIEPFQFNRLAEARCIGSFREHSARGSDQETCRTRPNTCRFAGIAYVVSPISLKATIKFLDMTCYCISRT